MSEETPGGDKLSTFLHKKTFGIPNMYLGVGGALVIGVIAWKMKATTPPVATDATAAPATEGDSTIGGDTGVDFSALDSGLAGTPTDTTVTTPTSTTLPNASIPDNQTWVSKGIQWLVANNKAVGTDAQQALTTYVSGANYTYDQKTLVDEVIVAQGPPPDPIPTLGQAGTAPAQKQFTAFPGTHTVKGPNDNNIYLLCMLYYGHGDAATINLVENHNPLLGGTYGPFAVGTQVSIPAYTEPKYYVTGGPASAGAIAAKNGTTAAAIEQLNDGEGSPKLTFPVAKNTRVRVA